MNNSQRSLRGVVSLDGWIAKFDTDNLASVHVDVVFREGHFGSSGGEKVKFKLSLRRAEIIIRVPFGEPLRVVKDSIARTPLPETASRETVRKTQGRSGASAKLGMSPTSIGTLDLGADASASREIVVTEIEAAKINRYLIQHFSTEEGQPGWEVSTRHGTKLLDGAPWDAKEDSRLNVRREAERNGDGDKPSLRVEIRCRREDIHIYGLEAKDTTLWSKFKAHKNNDVNLAAAEQLIKEELVKAGFLQVGHLSEGYAELLIADAILTEDW